MANYDATGSSGTRLTAGQQAERQMSTADQAALKAAGDKYNQAKAAGDTAAMEAAHKEAENIRAGYGYSGGTNGAGYTPLPSTNSGGGGGGGGGGGSKGGGGGNTPPATPTQQSYYIRDGQRVATNFVNGHNVNADGTAIQWKPGDISVTPSGQYYIIGDNGQARQIVSSNTNDTLALMNALGRSDGYTPKGSDLQIGIQQGFEDWLKANDPNGWSTYLNMALEWNSANTRGDTAAAAQIHKQMENFRNQYGHVGGSDGTLTRVTNPDNIPPELVELFQPLIDEYNQELAIEGMPPITMNEFLSLMNIGQYPEYIKAVIAQAPTSKLALQLSAMFPEYTVGEGVEKMEGLGYDPKYMPQYWNDFTNTYDYEKYAPEYDAIREQLIAANQAGVDLGRMQLEAQLQNALPEYDELRRQNALAQAKAANNTALYNQAQGDLGGIGSRRYSLEQNAYDQRMNEIQLEQQNLINTTNQQIAQLEAEGKMREAQLLAEWGQAKLEAMQEQYNLYWNMYQQGASAMENLEYGIASDEWDRLYKLRQDELNEQLNKYKADVDAYNAAVQRAQLQLGVDESNRDYDYNRWRDMSNIALQQAQLENAYNADRYNAAVDQQKLQLGVDESNRDFSYQRYLDDRNYNYQLGRDEVSDKRYGQEWAEQLRETAYTQAMQKLQLGMLSPADIEALGVPKNQAQTVADRINVLAQIDVDQARAELAYTRAQTAKILGSGSGSGGGGGGGGYYGGGGGSYSAADAYNDGYYGDYTTPGNPSGILSEDEYAAIQTQAQAGGVPVKNQSGQVVGYLAFDANGNLDLSSMRSNLNNYIDVGGRRLYYDPYNDDFSTTPKPKTTNNAAAQYSPESQPQSGSKLWMDNYAALTGDKTTKDPAAARAKLAQILGRKVEQLRSLGGYSGSYTSKVGGLERENGEWTKLNRECTDLQNLLNSFPQ